VPLALRAIVLGYEAGEAVATVKTGGWDALGADAQAIRTAVFVDEQGIPKELEWDVADASALHAVAYNRLGQPVATGRLLPYQPGVVKIGRMAVNRVLRGGHLGQQVLRALMHAAAQRGEREVVLHAQRSAEGFYKRLGFEQRGEPFEEAGIAHVEMFMHL
jgi:predicted GNAT family N-acyltransferase